MTVTVSKESTISRIMILRSFLYSIADGQEKPKGDEQRSASRNIGRAVGEFNG
jgi:hypothetical protein